ncbi:MAG: group II intron reverse transcriptase/maturase [Pseudomonadota bacterium]|nr:group II intron reverse transcriptase/maturase [Pseudomonadota bacterium]
MSDCQKAKNSELPKFRQLQRTLYIKAKQDQERRFHSLYDKIHRSDILYNAWLQVKSNKGAPGVDGKSIEAINSSEENVEKVLKNIQTLLIRQSYKFSAVRRVDIPKPKGGTRPLGIATVEDRIVQTAMKIVLEPIFEADFHECSYGYRPKRNAKQASLAIRRDLYDRAWGVVEIDLKNYFTSIPHGKLMRLVRKRVSDGSMLKLIKQTLIVAVKYEGRFEPTKIGVPQGSPLSPLYSNIYLNVVDQVWHKRRYPEKLGATMHRYADDIILVCRKSCVDVLKSFQAIVSRLDLQINAQKTQTTHLMKGFNFIGFEFIKRKSLNTGKNVIYIFPAKHSKQNIRRRIRGIAQRRAPIKPEQFIDQINQVVRGWANYYRHVNAATALRNLQEFINNRTRRYLQYRRKGRGFGFWRFSDEKLYQMGLIQIHSGWIKHSW